jgi:putative membrane protein
VLPIQVIEFLKAGIALTILFVIVRPLMKIIFLPLNLLTFGLFSFFLYIFSLHLFASFYGFFIIKPWAFPGASFLFLSIPAAHIDYFQNLVLSSFSLSSIISALDHLT